jgi:hypothetical protein
MLEDEADAAVFRRDRGDVPVVQQDPTLVDLARPAIMRSRVLLPLPLGPSRTNSSPVAIASETSSTTGTPSYRFAAVPLPSDSSGLNLYGHPRFRWGRTAPKEASSPVIM